MRIQVDDLIATVCSSSYLKWFARQRFYTISYPWFAIYFWSFIIFVWKAALILDQRTSTLNLSAPGGWPDLRFQLQGRSMTIWVAGKACRWPIWLVRGPLVFWGCHGDSTKPPFQYGFFGGHLWGWVVSPYDFINCFFFLWCYLLCNTNSGMLTVVWKQLQALIHPRHDRTFIENVFARILLQGLPVEQKVGFHVFDNVDMVLWYVRYTIFPTSLCGVLVFGSVSRPSASAPPPLTLHFVTLHLSHSTLSYTHTHHLSQHNVLHTSLPHTQLCHTMSQSFMHISLTHSFVTHTHISLTPKLCHTHNLLSCASLSHNFVTHTLSFTTQPFIHNFVTRIHTHNLSQHISLTQLCHMQLCHTQSYLNCVAHNLSQHNLSHTHTSHLRDIDVPFVWQAWHLVTSTLLLCGRSVRIAVIAESPDLLSAASLGRPAALFHVMQLCHTQLCHTQLFHTHTQLFHTHTTFSHTQLFHTQLFRTQLFHTTFSHTTLSHTTFWN